MATRAREKGANQAPVYLPVQPLLQGPDERLQRIGNLLPLLRPHPMPQHITRPLKMNGVLAVPFHPKGSFLVPSFLCDFFCLYQTQG